MDVHRSSPSRQVWYAWNAKEVVRQIYDHTDPTLAAERVDEFARDFIDETMPFEVRRLGRTIARLARPHRGLAPRTRFERADRSDQQPGQTCQTSRLRVPPVQAPPAPRPALRRQTQLDAPRRTHTTLKSEEPAKPYESLEPGELDELIDALEPLARLLLAAQDWS